MRDDFAVFILTHGRADNQVSYNALRKSGYTGKVFFVIDDLDEQGDRYRELYGDQVLVFDKEAEYEKTDTFTSNKILKGVVYARNACFELARQNGINWFINCDDDIKSFAYRLPEGDKLISVPVKNMDGLLEAMVDFMDGSGVECLSIAESGIYVGGLNNIKVIEGCQWSFTHFFMFNAESDIRFRSVWVEDIIFSVEKQKAGRKILSLTNIMQTMPTREEANTVQTGGMRDAYRESSQWVTAFTPVITAPDCFSVVLKDNVWKSHAGQRYFRTKILSESWKK